MAKNVAAAAQLFSELGAAVDEVDPGLGDCTEVFNTHWHVGVANAMAGVSDAALKLLDPGLDRFVLEGRKVPLMAYADAQNERVVLGHQRAATASRAHLAVR